MSKTKEEITNRIRREFITDRVSVTLWIIAVFGYGYLFGMVSYWFALALPVIILIRWVAANRMYSQGLLVGHFNDTNYVFEEVDKLLFTKIYSKLIKGDRNNGRDSGDDLHSR